MKTRTLVSILILVLALLVIAGGCATKKEVTKKSLGEHDVNVLFEILEDVVNSTKQRLDGKSNQ